MEPAFSIALGLVLTAATGAALAWLLRGAGIAGGRPAAAIVGGILAGTLLGPAVLGHVAPEFHLRVFRGGEAEREELRRTLARHSADFAASTATGSPPGTLVEVFARHSAERAPLERDLSVAMERRRAALTGAAAAALALGLLLAAWASRPLSVSPASVVMGVAAVAAEVAVIGAVAHLLLGAPVGLAVAAGAAGAGGSALAGFPLRWVPENGRSALARGVGAVMYILAMVVVLAPARDEGRAIAAALLAAPMLGWSLRLVTGGAFGLRGAVRWWMLWVALPTAAAMVAVHIEWELVGESLWAKVAVPVVLLLSGNAAFAGLWGAGRPISLVAWQRPVTAEALLDWQPAGFAATQVCLVLAVLGAGVADPLTPIGSGVLAGLLLSAAIGEMALTWLRQSLAAASAQGV